jgi:hypothetical protein
MEEEIDAVVKQCAEENIWTWKRQCIKGPLIQTKRML